MTDRQATAREREFDPARVDVGMLLARLGIAARRRGLEWHASCPLPGHEERKPSWSIRDEPGSPDLASHRCFGCSRGGGPVALVRMVRGLSSGEAREFLASAQPAVWRAPVVEVASRIPSRLAWPVDGALRFSEWPEAALRYWQRTRGLPLELARRVGAVATVQSTDAPRSVVFPVRSFGSLRTWVARSYVPTERRHDSASRDRGAQPDLALWGEPWLDPTAGPALVCEGVFDALSLTAVGLRNAVAVLGASSITPAKTVAVARCRAAIVCTDRDAAGDRAAAQLAGALARHCDVERALPPEGHDFGSAPVDSILDSVEAAAGRLACRRG